VAQLANKRFDPETVLARVNDPANVEAFEDLGVRAVSSVLATAQAIDNYVERPALADWMGDLGDHGDVQEIEVTSGALVGESISEVGPELPGSVIVALVTRDGETRVPSADLVLEQGDRITLIGDRDEVRDAMAFCHPS
jgi:K+ transport systems, NAD-binding component